MTGWLRTLQWLFADSHPTVDPVRDQRFVLWVLDRGERTPEGVAVGVPVAEARAVYPDAESLTRAGDPALLVCRPQRTYLLCHDGSRVTKIVAGAEEYVRHLCR